MYSPNQTKKWDKAEVKDLTDYHTVKESTFQNYINIWLRFFIELSVPQKHGVNHIQEPLLISKDHLSQFQHSIISSLFLSLDLITSYC